MEKVQKEKNEVWEWSKALIIAFGLAFLIRFFLFTPIVVDGESMSPTLESGDRMIVNKIEYRVQEPERYDIVVFHAPEEKDFIKRVIGLPGENIAYQDDQLYIDGKVVPEQYLEAYKKNLGAGTLTEDFTLEELFDIEEIPEGYVFVMGDNRRASKDSRYIGVISVDEIIGTTNGVFWPLDKARIVE